MKKATAITFFNDSVGKRMSMVYSEIDEKTAKIVSDNKRTDIVVTDKDVLAAMGTIETYVQNYIDTITARLCLRLGAETLPSVFETICADATVKMWRRTYYEGISSEGSANITTSFVEDILAESPGGFMGFEKTGFVSTGLGFAK